jgi:predicted permease
VTVLSGIVPVFMIIGLGVFARRMGWIDQPFVIQLNRVIYLLAIPALLVRLIGRAALGESLSLPLVAACAAATLAVGVVTWLGALWSGSAPDRRGVLVQAAVRGNLAFIGFPIILATGGEGALRVAAVTAAVLIPFQNLVSIVALAAGRSSKPTTFVRVLVFNPVVLGVCGGVLWSVSGWPGWVWFNSFLDILSGLALPGALLAVGAQLQLEGLRAELRSSLVVTVLKLVAVPALGWFAMSLLHVAGTEVLVGVFLLAAPTAVVSAAIAQEMGGDTELARAAIVASSLASFPAYIAWALVL